MITIVMANRKGGVGKSTLSVHLAWFIAQVMDKRVLFVDLDDQANSSSTLIEHATGIKASAFFQREAIPPIGEYKGNIALLQADPSLKKFFEGDLMMAGEFADKIESVSDGFDFCVIDTSPAWNRTHEAALFAADYFATPVDMESYAIQGLTEFLDNTRRVMTFKRSGGKGLDFIGIVPNRVNNTSPAHKEKLEQLRDAYKGLITSSYLGNRTSIGEAIDEHIPVWKVDKSAAREAGKEMKRVFTELLQRIASRERAKVAA
ncbi:Chromosome-partitioning ATPase Soj (plasmid) [Xanthomonas hydrangeae]|uniref:ParA family protein n=1 Tax=Xanthomonas hydrangeae TaxID=2775159 RepID=UPI00196425AA|nr:Chromosome-partitioning ATPase Soj [Xanthomonas hydrangeae]CAD7740904.1 Chromosome-partitioning ATPase Soj [Xanthomonas hydrangeae]CAD7748272.1 Chromosome-partitioning ATPase Soj [Xanthomonas hydrangeae]CAD7748273.1 Chromosome-partitioning ATPase Soj [Xanthomonas hydrangeae]